MGFSIREIIRFAFKRTVVLKEVRVVKLALLELLVQYDRLCGLVVRVPGC
jgi:hypothetical protein